MSQRRSWNSRSGLVVGAIFAMMLLSACDGYREVVTLEDKQLSIDIDATVICSDPMLADFAGPSFCEDADSGDLQGEANARVLPEVLQRVQLDLNVTGELDRRNIIVRSPDVEPDQVSTLLVNSARFDALSDTSGRVTFETEGSMWMAVRSDADFEALQRESRWPDPVFQFVAPDLVVDHNGDAIDGRVVTWNLDGLDSEPLTVTWSTEDPPRRWWWWVVGSAILVGILVMMMALEPKRHG